MLLPEVLRIESLRLNYSLLFDYRLNLIQKEKWSLFIFEKLLSMILVPVEKNIIVVD